jgi:hypothetical protein
VTDSKGHFIFPQRLQPGDRLVFSFIGFNTYEYTVKGSSASEEIIIDMKVDEIAYLGGVIVGGVRTTNYISFRRWWWKLKGWFS